MKEEATEAQGAGGGWEERLRNSLAEGATGVRCGLRWSDTGSELRGVTLETLPGTPGDDGSWLPSSPSSTTKHGNSGPGPPSPELRGVMVVVGDT